MIISVSPTLQQTRLGNTIEPLRKDPKKRIWEIDFLRGFFFLTVVAYHLAWDMAFMPSMIFSNWSVHLNDYPNLYSLAEWCYELLRADYMKYLVNICSGAFLVLTGISCSFSRSNIKRAFITCLIALALTYVTFISSMASGSDMTIVFGILHNMGLTLLIYSIFELICKWCKVKMNPWVLLVIGLALCGYGWYLNYGPSVPTYYFKELNPQRLLQVMLGFANTYTDDFGIMPYSGKILIGIALGIWLYKEKKSLLPMLDGIWNKPICFLGRHTFIVYIVHQPIIWTIMIIVLMCFGFSL